MILWRNYHVLSFNTNPSFPPFLLYVRCKSGVTFIRRCFRDACNVFVSMRLNVFQIDFVASMRVEGVQFHRVQMVNSYSGSNGVLFKFGVEYGSNSSNLQMLSRVLVFDVFFKCFTRYEARHEKTCFSLCKQISCVVFATQIAQPRKFKPLAIFCDPEEMFCRDAAHISIQNKYAAI